MKRSIAGYVLLLLLALPAMAQRGMSAGRGFGGGSVAGRGFGGRGGFVGGAVTGRGFAPHAGIFIGHPHGGVVIRTTPFPHGGFHHGRFHPFFPNSFCFQSPFLCRSRFGFNPLFAGGWSDSWLGYGYPYALSYPDAYNDQIEATMAQQQQAMAEMEEQIRQERLSRMEADAAQPAPTLSFTPADQKNTTEPLTPTVLVYRDQHRVEVGNYAIVGETLYEFTPRWTRKISLAELDLPATVQVNEERGVRFHVPSYRAQVVTRP